MSKEKTNITFKLVSERICIITTKTSDNIKCYLISAYTLTSENIKRNLGETRILYEQLSSLVNSIIQSDKLVIGKVANATTKLKVLERKTNL